MGGSSSITIGYTYRMGVHFVPCHGPVDALVAIRVGQRPAWSGDITASGDIAINKPDLFGGSKKEGGVVGTATVMMGDSAQTANAYLTAQQGADQPAYRGLLGVVYRGIVAQNNPYPKPWAFRVQKALTGWEAGGAWYPATCVIPLAGGIAAMNPAHIILKVGTHPTYGLGYPRSAYDLASFTVAADALFAEGFGMCLLWAQPEPVNAFIGRILDHIGGALSLDRTTGLIRIKLIRDDYTVSALPSFGPGTGLLGVIADDTGASGVPVNQISATWHDPITDKDGSVTAQNLAVIESVGHIVAETRHYPGIPTADLAERVVLRDVNISTSDLHRYTLRLDRRGHDLQPGDPFVLVDPSRGITSLVLRAITCDYGSPTDATIMVKAMQDVFGLPAAGYTTPQVSGWAVPDASPLPVPQQVMFESPYVQLAGVLRQADLDVLPADAGYLAAVGSRPSGLAVNYSLQTRLGAEAFLDRAVEDFAPVVTLVNALPPAAVGVTSVVLGTTELDAVVVGSLAMLGSELLRVDAVDVTLGTITLARGCGDSVPSVHAAGDMVWFIEQYTAGDPREYVLAEVVDARLVTRTGAGSLDPALAPISSVTMAERQVRPYPPGALQLNAVAYPATISGALVLTWAHRDRLQQADQLIDTSAASIGPEAGTTYTLRLYNENDVLSRTETGLTGVTYTWATEAADSLILSSGSPTDTQTFDVDPGTTLYTIQLGSPTISWDSTNFALTVAGSTVQNFMSWDEWGSFATGTVFEMDFVFLADSAGRLHQGMFLSNDVAGTGIRIAHLDTKWTFSEWNAGTESPAVEYADIPIVVGGTYTLSVTWGAGNVFSVSLGGVFIGTITVATFSALRPGVFCYGSTMNVLEFRVILPAYRLNNNLRLELEADRAGLVSKQMYNVSVVRV